MLPAACELRSDAAGNLDLDAPATLRVDIPAATAGGHAQIAVTGAVRFQGDPVLDGTSDAPRSLALEPGDLQIFKGRYALHRVSPVEGQRARYVGIFSFVETPAMVGSVERTRQLYGRALPIHVENEGQRSDTLVD